MSDMPIGAVLAEMFSEPGHPTELQSRETSEVLKSMLTENTGRHILDSGGAYGRNFERNAEVDLDDQPECEVRWSVYEAGQYSQSKTAGELEVSIEATVSVYHFLNERVDFEPELDAAFHKWADQEFNRDKGWLELMEEWADDQSCGGEFSPMTVNTYNHESSLSQVIQYSTYRNEDDEQIFLIQIHGGCDVRGGYTAPHLFSGDIYSMFDDDRMYAHCEGGRDDKVAEGQIDLNGDVNEQKRCCAAWDSDNAGYSFYDAGNMYPEEKVDNLDKYPVERGSEGKRRVLVIDEEHNRAFCPVCGNGTLAIYGPIPN